LFAKRFQRALKRREKLYVSSTTKRGEMHGTNLEDFAARTLVPVKRRRREGKALVEDGRQTCWEDGIICSVTDCKGTGLDNANSYTQ